ncbi:MAG: DNA polymerase III subunit chi [Arenicellales bacterium]
MPSRVDFYILDSSDEMNWLCCACRIAGKAYQQGMNVYMQVESGDHAREVDRLLWTFHPTSFIPHEVLMQQRSPVAPVLIGTGPAPDRWDSMLITLTREVPSDTNRFDRVADLIINDEQHKLFGRERFRFYRNCGIEPNTHQISVNS